MFDPDAYRIHTSTGITKQMFLSVLQDEDLRRHLVDDAPGQLISPSRAGAALNMPVSREPGLFGG
jgi:hypothetical protein